MLSQQFGKALALSLLGLSLSFSSVAVGTVSAEDTARAIPEIEWDTSLEKFQYDQEKFIGQRFTAKCPPAPRDVPAAGTENTASFPSTQAICPAAFQAGQIDKVGGIVTVQLNPGGAGDSGEKTSARTIVVVKESGSEAADQLHLEYVPRIKWDTKFTATGFAYKQLIGQRFTFNCPAAPSNMRARRVVGTDLYAFHSMVCRAAVHAGTITTDGGLVTVQMNPKTPKLVGSIRNGVETKDGTSGLSALSFVANPVSP